MKRFGYVQSFLCIWFVTDHFQTPVITHRDQGWGGTLTTFPAGAEAEVQALFGMPHYMAAAALVPLGRPVKQLTKLRRDAVESFVTIDHADGEALRPG